MSTGASPNIDDTTDTPWSVPSTAGSAVEEEFNARTWNFHKVLQEVGKTVFRPGGTGATETLHSWAAGAAAAANSLSKESQVLEVAGGIGKGGMALAKRCECRVLLTDIDRRRLERAAALAANDPTIAGKIETQVVDMHHLDRDLGKDQKFDAAVLEAALTHCSDPQKFNILENLHSRTNQILLHEVCLNDDMDAETLEQTKTQVSQALKICFAPLTEQGWKQLLAQAGYQVTHIQVAPLHFLSPLGLIQDEGLTGAATVVWNLITRPELRERVVATKAALRAHQHVLRYIIVRAIAQQQQQEQQETAVQS